MVSIKSLMGNEALNEMQRTKLGRDMQEEEAFRQPVLRRDPEQMSAPDFLQRAVAPRRARRCSAEGLLDQKQQQAAAELWQDEGRDAQAAKAKEARDALAGVSDQAGYQSFPARLLSSVAGSSRRMRRRRSIRRGSEAHSDGDQFIKQLDAEVREDRSADR
jgi:hypothetical protein